MPPLPHPLPCPTPARRRLPLRPLLATLAAAVALPASTSPFVHVSPAEFLLRADLDGDGQPDLVLVDRESGSFRVGYQLAPDHFTFVPGRSTGLRDLSAVSAGRIGGLNRDALVVASVSGNRLHWLAAPAPDSIPNPQPVHLSGLGPALVVAIDIGGAGNTGHADLVAVTTQDNPPAANRRLLIRHPGAAFTEMSSQAIGGLLDHANPVILKDGSPAVLALIERPAADTFWRAYSLATGAAVQVAATPAPAGHTHAHGRFAPGALHHVLLFAPGPSTLTVHAVEEPAPNTFALGPVNTHDLGSPIHQLFVVETQPAHHLLVVFDNGAIATLFQFDGSASPVPIQSLQAPPGELFTGATPLPDGRIHLYSGTGPRSDRFHAHRFQNGQLELQQSGNLPPVNPLGTAGNVFLFQQEPFVSPSPGLLTVLNAADWSSSIGLGGANVSVQAETFASAHQGLANPTARDLGPKPAVAAFGLVNQYRPAISIASFQPALGAIGSEPRITPPQAPSSGPSPPGSRPPTPLTSSITARPPPPTGSPPSAMSSSPSSRRSPSSSTPTPPAPPSSHACTRPPTRSPTRPPPRTRTGTASRISSRSPTDWILPGGWTATGTATPTRRNCLPAPIRSIPTIHRRPSPSIASVKAPPSISWSPRAPSTAPHSPKSRPHPIRTSSCMT